ncbi:MAG TPA: DUF4386 domain-containing protein [Vicinamibacterales bacterium]|jgi:hypothetical protein|nr:DUF4386 domain-containing protein [Vicinamibacterales bacterium]
MTAGEHASINRTARLAGALYLAAMPFGFFGIMYVPSVLLVPGDPAATSRNILASEWLFRSGTVSHLIGQIIFIFQVLALYRLLQPVNKNHAVLMVILVLVGIPIAFLNEVNHLAALRLLSGTDDGAFTSTQRYAQAMLFLDMREYGIGVAHVFWGLWLLPLGFLVFRSVFLPRLLGILLMIGGAAHVIDAGTQLLFPGVPTVSQFTFAFAILAAIGELLFALWLLIKGVNVKRWQQITLA